MQVDGQHEDRDREEAREQSSTLRHPVLALASALGCREGQAYSVVVAGIIAVLLAALGIPPVLSHHPKAIAAARTLPTPTGAPAPAAAPPVVPEVTSPAAPATELPPIVPALALPPNDGAVLPSTPPPAATDVAPPMTGTGSTLQGREGTPLLDPIPASGQVALVSNAAGRQLTATIDWGDGGAPSPGEISATSEQSFQVTASHVYTKDGDFKITVTITDTAGASLIVISRAQIADPPDALNKALDDALDAAG
jgi:hypothetical protein